MTALAIFPNKPSDFARLTEHQRRANEAEEREANLITARAVLNNPAMHRTQDVRNAIILLESKGDMRGDLIMADEATHHLAIRERRGAHAAAKAQVRAETAKFGKVLAALCLGYVIAMAVIMTGLWWMGAL